MRTSRTEACACKEACVGSVCVNQMMVVVVV